ncbi:MAG: CDP-2,3-bis-(O-geranylgeranyl)-sn-glycerol synthase [Candidatus Aenigmatarchaeota archaeon]|nr:MAG: CDP-2,3-bis-(O-geranylgeranyl)-sn-glycerol synthase [Candidatus Aenigmarchaeota archaeon]
MVAEIFTIYTFVEALWLVLPAYAANGLVPLFKGKKRLDFGRNFLDGRPILGKGKTLEGLVIGSVIGIIIALIQMIFFPVLPWGLSDRPLTIIPMGPVLGFLLGFGAMAGDSAASFIKRRFNIRSGGSAPILDQLDFLFGAFLFASLAVTIKLEWVILMAILTPVFHYAACVIGYLLKIKKEPW